LTYAGIETAPEKREAKMIGVQTTQDGNSKPAPARPLGLFITIVRAKGGTIDDETKHIRAFKALLDEEGYEDFRDAVIDEWARIKYSTAFAAANPPTASELRQRLEQQKREREEERKAIDAIKFKIVKRALLLVMPNGKQLGCCTGAECACFGGFFAKISERVGATQLVGDVLTTRDLIEIANSDG
jgi:hypothetical protein